MCLNFCWGENYIFQLWEWNEIRKISNKIMAVGVWQIGGNQVGKIYAECE